MMGQVALTLVQPWPIQMIVDELIKSAPQGHETVSKHGFWKFVLSSVEHGLYATDFDFLFKGIGILFAIYLASAFLLYMQNSLLAHLSQRVVLRVRENLFSHLLFLPHNFFEKVRTGDLTSRISKDTADIQDILEGAITIMVRSLPTILGILIVSFALDWVYALTFIFVIPLIFWANVLFARSAKEAVRRQRRIEGAMASRAQEAFCHHKAVATLSLENELVEDFRENGRESATHGVDAGRFQGMLTASMDFLVGVTTLAVLLIGGLRTLHGCLTVGQLMVFLSYLNSIFKPIRETSKFTIRLAKSATAVERVEEIMHMSPHEIGATELPHAMKHRRFKGHIEFRDIVFGYQPNSAVLQAIDFSVAPGKMVALVGDSGSGKSSLLHLLMRLYDPQQGVIRIDGTEIRAMKLSSLRKQLSVVLQDSYIFNMTILENIGLAKPGATRAEAIKAAKAAGAHGFIQRLPQGYETPLGEGGSGLSGGQKRRLAIARAILRDAPIVLLDEPTAGLDAASERKVVEALKRLTRNKTTFIVTHQLSTVVDADLILVLSGGRIVERGVHEQLLRQGGFYASLWQAQHHNGSARDHRPFREPIEITELDKEEESERSVASRLSMRL